MSFKYFIKIGGDEFEAVDMAIWSHTVTTVNREPCKLVQAPDLLMRNTILAQFIKNEPRCVLYAV